MLPTHFIIKKLNIFLVINIAKCSIDGLSYLDPMKKLVSTQYAPGEDPCNPLYWYPRNIPEYCDYKKIPIPGKSPSPPLPMPIPVPIPQPSIFMPIAPPPALLPAPLPVPLPALLPGAPMAYGVQMAPGNPTYPIPLSLPHVYGGNPQQAGMIPGVPGLVTKDGGINILPFSDVYSDLIENHKNKMIRRRLQKLIEDYEDFPNGRSYGRIRKYASKNYY